MTGRIDGGGQVPALRHVLVVGAAMIGACAVHGGVRGGISAAAGVALSAVNLWLLTRVVGAFVARPAGGSSGWGAVAAVKALLLYGAVFVLVQGRLVEAVPLLVGLLSLPLGIVARTLLSRGDSVV